MRVVIQRVTGASVRIRPDGPERTIEQGLVVLVGVTHHDTPATGAVLAAKVCDIRIFGDDDGKMTRGLADLPGAGLLIVSQFTLFADTRKGRRPSFMGAAPPELARTCYDAFVQAAIRWGKCPVQTGEFGADMALRIENDGPVTVIIDTDEWERKEQRL